MSRSPLVIHVRSYCAWRWPSIAVITPRLPGRLLVHLIRVQFSRCCRIGLGDVTCARQQMHENRSGRMRLGSSCTNWAVGAHLNKGLLDQWPLATSAVSRQEIGGRETAIPTVQLPWCSRRPTSTQLRHEGPGYGRMLLLREAVLRSRRV